MQTVLAAAAALLVVTGVAKLLRPAAAAAALGAITLRFGPRGDLAGRALGTVEVVVGLTTLLTRVWPAAALTAALYLGFAAFVVLALRPDRGVASCGCSGQVDTPPTRVHVVVDLAFAGFAIAAAVRTPNPLLRSLDRAESVLALAAAALVASLAWLAITALPRLAAARASLV
jgi:hypothetical protein